MNAAPTPARTRGQIQLDAAIALAILGLTVLPLGFGFLHHRTLARHANLRASILELLDSEMEILAAGEHRSFADGTQPYPLHGFATVNMPPGQCRLTRTPSGPGRLSLHLEWKPDRESLLAPVHRSIELPLTQ